MADEKVKDTNYFTVQGWMVKRLKLKGIALQVYAIIYGFTQNEEDEFTGSIQYLCEFTGVSRPTICNALKELVSNELLIRTDEYKNGVLFPHYKANLQVVKNLYGGSKETLQGGSKETLQGGSKETLHNNILQDNKYIDNKKDIKEYIVEIVSYLNSKLGTNYKPETKNTQTFINARLKDGYTVTDFKTVIDKKVSEWKGSDMEKYLRPETLFGNKFESYLNQRATSKGKPAYHDSDDVNLDAYF